MNAHVRDSFVQFCPVQHRYWIHGSSRLVISVTSLAKSTSFDAARIASLVARKEGCDIATVRARWTDASIAGTRLHLAIHNYFNGVPVDPGVAKLPEWGYFLDFLRDHPTLRPLRTEYAIYLEDPKLAGCVDIILRCYVTGKLFLCDWKRVRQITRQKQEDWRHQLGLYNYVLTKGYRKKISEMQVVVLHPAHGKYVKVPITMDDAWVSTTILKRMEQLARVRAADAAALVERDAARALLAATVANATSVSLTGGPRREAARNVHDVDASNGSATAELVTLDGLSVVITGRDASPLEDLAKEAGMIVRTARAAVDVVVLDDFGDNCTAAAFARARGRPVLTRTEFVSAAQAQSRAKAAACAADRAAVAVSGGGRGPALAVPATTAAATAKTGRRPARADTGRNVDRDGAGTHPTPSTFSPGVYASNECGAWRRPITFQETADNEGAIRREAARIAEFLRSHSGGSSNLALHAAVYLVRVRLPAARHHHTHI